MKTELINLIEVSDRVITTVLTTNRNWFRKTIVLLLFVISVTVTQGQVTDYKQLLSSITDAGEVAKLESLVSDLQPTVYISNSEIKSFGETSAVCAEVDAQAVGQLKLANPLFEKVELITVRVERPEDLLVSLDLSSLQGFKSLKYVQVLSTVSCTAEQINKIITGSKPGVVVFYLISRPS